MSDSDEINVTMNRDGAIVLLLNAGYPEAIRGLPGSELAAMLRRAVKDGEISAKDIKNAAARAFFDHPSKMSYDAWIANVKHFADIQTGGAIKWGSIPFDWQGHYLAGEEIRDSSDALAFAALEYVRETIQRLTGLTVTTTAETRYSAKAMK